MNRLAQQWLAVALLVLPQAAVGSECPDPAQLQSEALEVVRLAFPDRHARQGPNGTIEAGGLLFDLENLRKRLCAPPGTAKGDRAPLIREHFRMGLQSVPALGSGKGKGWEAARDRVLVQLVPEEMAARTQIIRRRLVDGVAVVVVLDLPTAYLYVGKEALSPWGIAEGEIFDRAIQNLALKTRGEMRAGGDGTDRVLFVGEQDGYDAARLLTPRLRKAAAGLLGDPFRAAIPNRDFLVMWSRGHAALAREAAANARADFETQPYPISPLILEVWADGRIVAVPPANR